MATASDNGTTVKESKPSPPIEKMKTSSSGGQVSSKVAIKIIVFYSNKRAPNYVTILFLLPHTKAMPTCHD